MAGNFHEFWFYPVRIPVISILYKSEIHISLFFFVVQSTVTLFSF